MTAFRLRIMAQVLPFLLIAPGIALAQAPSRGQAMAAVSQPAQPGAAQYTRQQIDQLVAPIAVYPDQLLSEVLMAASYPQQIIDAADWLKNPQNKALKGDALAQALEPMPWDPSVKALVVFPQVIDMLAEHIEWTQALGVAFATQQKEVMVRIQGLRHVAVRSGHLKKMKHLAVRQEGSEVVITEEQPGQIFVPVYNPTVVYGEWPDRDYPPVFIAPPPGFVAETIEPGIEVSAGYAVVGPLWGWSRPDWRGERITINRTDYTRITRNAEIGPGDSWRHNGAVVLVAPTAREHAAAANVPAGTVAPARAAAVTSLPQRAAADPNRIKTQSATGEQNRTPTGQTPAAQQPSSTAKTAPTTTTGQQPSSETAKTAPTTTTGQKPSSETAKTAPTTTTGQKPSSETAKTQPTAEKPGAAKSESARTQPSTEPGKTATPSTQSGTTQPEKMPGTQPGLATRGHREHQPNLNGTGENRNAAEPGTETRERTAPGHTSSQAPGATEPNRRASEPLGTQTPPNASRSQPTGSSKPPEAQRQGVRETEHPGTQHPGGAAEHTRQPTTPGEAAGEGSSTPPHAAAPHPAPAAQPSHEPGSAPQPQGKGEEKKER